MAARLLFVLDRLALGGAELHTVSLARELANGGCDCKVVALEPTPDDFERPRLPGVVPRPEGRSEGVLEELLRAWKPALVVVTHPRALRWALGAARRARWREPLAVILHRMPAQREHPRAWRKQRRLLRGLARADAIVFPSRIQMQAWQRLGVAAQHCRVIGNGIDLQRFSEAWAGPRRAGQRAALGFDEEDVVLGTCCALRRSKRVDDFVRVVQQLRRSDPRVRGLVVGDGPCRAELQQLVRELGLEDALHFTGYRCDVRNELAAIDIGVLCSHSEVFGLFAAECMALSRPMVMAEAGGSSEVVEHGASGALFTPGGPQRIAAAIEPLLDAGVRARAGACAAQTARERFCLRTMSASYRALFIDLAGSAFAPDPSRPGTLELLG